VNFLNRSTDTQQGNTGQLRSERFAVNEREQEAVDTKEFYADKVAVVTGGASGIGLTMTELMLGFGAAVIIADINETKLNTAAPAIPAHHTSK
jgi:NADPH:quinone reductase-like Zn-dependent oxidoreductase